MRMRKTVLLLLLTGLAFTARAQYAGEKLSIGDVEVTRTGDDALVTMRVAVSPRAVKSSCRMVVVPVITDGDYKVSLSPIVVEGRRARIAHERRQWASGTDARMGNANYVKNGTLVDYRASVPFQPWMESSRLVLESCTEGCCSATLPERELLAENILYVHRDPPVVYVPEPDPGFVPVSVADTLSLTYSFVIPEAEWNADEPIYDEDRENALIVYYRVNLSNIDPGFGNNASILADLVMAVNRIVEARDSDVKRVVVAGFASPEGPFDFNDRLAWERAVSVKEYIMKNTGLDDSIIVLYNGSEDWRGLRAMVEASDMYDRDRILEIIDTVPMGNGRKTRLEEIRKLSGGASYRYMLENFFPRLRNGAFIRVYYENLNQR